MPGDATPGDTWPGTPRRGSHAGGHLPGKFFIFIFGKIFLALSYGVRYFQILMKIQLLPARKPEKGFIVILDGAKIFGGGRVESKKVAAQAAKENKCTWYNFKKGGAWVEIVS